MKATIVAFLAPSIVDLENYVPSDPARFGFGLSFNVAIVGGVGEDVFYLTVCSPAWLADHLQGGEVRSMRHHLVTGAYDWPAIRAFVVSSVESLDGESWLELAEKLSRFAMWEFEDYQELVVDIQPQP